MISDVSVPTPHRPPQKPISKKKPRKKLGKRKVRDEDQQKTPVHTVKVFTTTKPIRGLEEKCPFFFNISLDAEEKRWFILCKQKGCQSHVGHMRMSNDIVQGRAVDLPEKELELQGDMAASGTPLAVQERLILKRNEFSLAHGGLQYLRKQQAELCHNTLVSCPFGSAVATHKAKTPADKLLAHFDGQDHLSYVALFAHFGTNKLTIKKKMKRGTDHSVVDHELDDLTDNAGGAELLSSQWQQSAKEERIRQKLTVGSVILLAFAWTDNDSRLRFDMFPELMAMDTTQRTNEEERPLLLVSGIDGHNTTHTHTWVFMPAEARWAFDWILTEVLPSLHRDETLRRVRVIFTDQEGQLVVSVTKKQSQKHSWLRKVSYRLCAWHKFDRNLTELKECRTLTSVLNEDSSCEWNAIVSWLWMLARRPETIYESNLLFALLELYLDEDQTHHRGIIGPDLKNLLTDFFGQIIH